VTEKKLILRNRIIGLLLRDAREQAGRTKSECAAALGISASTITAYEDGRQSISLPELEVLAYVLNTPITHFLDPDPQLATEKESLALEDVLELRHRIVGALLRQARTDADMTQKDLADILDCSASHISAYEYGKSPIPVAELELLVQHLDLRLEYFLDTQRGPVGKWHQQENAWQRFCELPEKVKEFISQPINIKYMEVAMRLADMPAGGLRDIAAGLLDITY